MSRFGLTGGIAFVIDFGGLVLLHGALGWKLQWAIVVSYCLGGAVHYTLTRRWVFVPRLERPEVDRIARYLALGTTNIVVNLAAVLVLVRLGVDYRVSKAGCVAMLVVINYLVTSRHIMR
jgi:putative flippase GtrA